VNFRLIYEGPLPANGTPGDKQAIRRVLHPQLAELWNQPPLLRFVHNGQLLANSVMQPSLLVERGGFGFVPVVTTRLHLIAHLDVLFLRPGIPGALIGRGGDIDNRLKTLFDALQIPDANQIMTAPPDAAHATNTATPFFCVLEDDALITRVNVETDRLLKPDVYGVGDSRVLLVINVTLRVVQLAHFNMELAS
jgi:hypothetical protein